MFDCVIPTREGRHGRLFVDLADTTEGDLYRAINIRNEQYREDFTPVDSACDCLLCTKYTRAYLRHLFVVGEALVLTLTSLHNLRFYTRLIERLREGK